MTFVRTLNGIIDELESVEHGDSVLECLNNIIAPETRYETTDDAVEFLVKQYVESREE